MTKRQIITKVSRSTGIKYNDTERIIEAFLSEIAKQWRIGKVSLRGFGTFTWKKYAAKKGRDISRNIQIDIPAQEKPIFRASNNIKPNSPMH
ncbi:HU family DNA-binding protein [Roseivirga pacifica]|uniref:HU family DNA-binding protein n=1 Tax=Roseivirga pacifica TaxID=1267423 RepID=UPI002095C9B6|nr:HU family DNA-binding protein [Roseivirga pacifica]